MESNRFEFKLIYVTQLSQNPLRYYIQTNSRKIMHVEYEEFDTVEDIFRYMASVIPPMKNTMPINSYKGYVFSIIPLSPSTGDVYLLIYTKGKLDGKILEYDINANSYKTVNAIERADKVYFIVMTPKRNTLVDQALKNL